MDEEHSRILEEFSADGDSVTEIPIESKKDVNQLVETAIKPKTNEDVQRAIEGLKDIPDEELQEFLDDEDFMKGLDVVDAWEGEEEKRGNKRQRSRSNDKERKRTSRDRIRNRDHRSPIYRDKPPRREERKREENRRDPSKSTKDIEKDKLRTKKDTDSKILAAKEKAIKYILDSDEVVPPGTEVDAIKTIAEKQDMERLARSRNRRSRERRKSTERRRGSPRRRSSDKVKRSPHRHWSPIVLSPEYHRSSIRISPSDRRSPLKLISPRRRSSLKASSNDRRSPLILSPERRRSPLKLSPNHPRRLSRERQTSAERRRSSEQHRRRVIERELRHLGHRSRSRERHRSRSTERRRNRYSRSPANRRGSPRWRSRSTSRGKSPHKRSRKRSPFINEITRQFRSEGLLPPTQPGHPGFPMQPTIPNLPPLMGPPVYPHEQEHIPYVPHQQSGPQGMPGGPPGFMNFEPVHPHGPPIHFNPNNPQPLLQSEFSSGPVIYNQHDPAPILLPQPVPSPQPVPAPLPIEQRSSVFKQSNRPPLLPTPGQQQIDIVNKRSTTPHIPRASSNTPHSYSIGQNSPSPYDDQHSPPEERLKTPEPPVISDTKASFGKTSLSSLLEASVSAKDSSGPTVLYPGFKPEILRHCEHALRDLPVEDPRLKMKGRFFFNPKQEDPCNENEERSSNSILLRKGRNKIYWDEEEERHSQLALKPGVQMHQKICQTDEVQTDTAGTQTTVTTADFGIQVYPYDLQPSSKEEKRTIMDRLDWTSRETFDYAPKPREADDLRWSLSNSSQKRSWGRNTSPIRGPSSRGLSGESMSSNDYARNMNLSPPVRVRSDFQPHRGALASNHFIHKSYASGYRQDIEEQQDHFLDDRSDRSRGESPMVIDDSPEELDEEPEMFSRAPERHIINKIQRGPIISDFKPRGGPRGRPFRGRGGFRGKF